MPPRLLFACDCEIEVVEPGLWRVRLPDGEACTVADGPDGLEGHPAAVEAICQAEYGLDPTDPWAPCEG